MFGIYPYCGANGVVGLVDSYVLDDDVILLAEDGGYFDDFAARPIAYRMTGKIWVNNHAHILRAKPNSDQAFLFYSLVHKDITPFLASGTRAKLNKSEMNKIVINHPLCLREQFAIGTVLRSMDEELGELTVRQQKFERVRKGMMQQLLTGRIRLV
jgi:type I restriction enzyme S subunit